MIITKWYKYNKEKKKQRKKIYAIYSGLGPFQTSLFSCAEPNVNEQNPLFELICIKFGAWEERRLN